ncbi:pentapeptide repeat-containing protein [Legionella israelensis]|uniref:Pentapeptide repeats (8 copies) n=1 Tax=Legionella israelensis TaxID=454 RepID=A0A0W0VP74_9GAMM|nr:pentapeptide repeat-containing protein [Legionella israelensis]KTD21545.1 Pentapeptide repeats (8 copies) [Legionella israelensis]QBS09128.1 hypothetical protein E4T55_04235 [Legionella israelensis]SCY51711.1 Pentapeptide repeat-containing protein [Legionella israelensis DSM 19235]STX58857.1 Uncharacterized protein conserved in bacteria [Legionella israelensis]
MKYKVDDQMISLSFESLQDVILGALKSRDKEFSIAVYDEENNKQIATAVINVSGSAIELDELQLTKQFKEDNASNPQAIIEKKNEILAELSQSLIKINQEVEDFKKQLSTSVVEYLSEYKELFIQYPIQQSELHQFIDRHENSGYKEVFDNFLPEFSNLNTPPFQDKLSNLYKELISLEKKLNNPDINEERRISIIKDHEKKITDKKQTFVTFFSELKNLPMLFFLARELPKFQPAAKAWEEHKKHLEEENVENTDKLNKVFNKKYQKELDEIYNDDEILKNNVQKILTAYIAQFPEKYEETTKVEIPEFLLKHKGMRQKIIELLKTEAKIDPIDPLKRPALEELVSLLNNNSFLTDPTLMDLYSHEKIENYSRVKPQQNFNGYNLQYLSIDGFHLRSSTFIKANLANASLTNCKLFNANFSEADLSGTNFKGADLEFVQWGRAIFSEDTIIDWDKYGADIILSQLKAIGQAKDLNLAQKKAEAKNCINFILPKINSNKTLLKLVELIEGKHRDFAYLREEQALWRFNQYGNTKTWSTIIGQIKDQLDKNVTEESKKPEESRETYSGEDYKTFLKIMDEHRGRGFGPVTHSKFYEHLTESTLQNIKSMNISKK